MFRSNVSRAMLALVVTLSLIAESPTWAYGFGHHGYRGGHGSYYGTHGAYYGGHGGYYHNYGHYRAYRHGYYRPYSHGYYRGYFSPAYGTTMYLGTPSFLGGYDSCY